MVTHFILTKGELIPQYKRAIRSAQVHGGHIILWHSGYEPDLTGVDAEPRKFNIPAWLQNSPGYEIFDWVVYDLAYRHGGLFLQLDTYSLRPAGDLLGDKEIVVSRDVPNDNWTCKHPWNNIFVCQADSKILYDMRAAAKTRIKAGGTVLGDTGPALLTDFVWHNPDKMAGAPFPALCGWEGSYIWQFYCGMEKPKDSVRVIHLFSTAYPELFYDGDIEAWLTTHPDFSWVRQFTTAWPKVDPVIFA